MNIYANGEWIDSAVTPMVVIVNTDDIDIITEIGQGDCDPCIMRGPANYDRYKELFADAMVKLKVRCTTIEVIAGLEDNE